MCRISKRALAFCLIVLTLLSCVSCDSKKKSDFSITFFDVGYGDSALVSCDGHYMLIDAGSSGTAEKVKKALQNNSVIKLDFLVISHTHQDHCGGLEEALRAISTVERTFSIVSENDLQRYLNHSVQKPAWASDDSEDTISFCEELGLVGCNAIEIPKAGDEFKLGSAVVKIMLVGNPEKANDSLVIMVTYGSTTFLFTGDMGERMEKDFVDEYPNVQITLLKVAHHGAKTSTTEEFVKSIEPKYAVISVSEKNPYGHPENKVLDVLNQAGTKIYRTDIDGNIIVTSDGQVLSFKTEK